MVAIAPPSTHVVTGSVPSAGLVASAMPASPLIEASVELLLNSMAWQAASKVTLRRVLSIYTVLSGASEAKPHSTDHDHAKRSAQRNPLDYRPCGPRQYHREIARRNQCA